MLLEESLQVESKSMLRSDELRRSLGAFYTPSFLSNLLCVWAIRNVEDVVLEPSFGGCTFLEEVAGRFKALGAINPLDTVFGCDIDLHAFEKLDSLEFKSSRENFVLEDFLALNVASFCPEKADVIIGNPPYIGHSQISHEQRDVINKWKLINSEIDARSSLWVYFLIHSLSFLKVGGRLAFVLPGSFLSADYSKKIHELLGVSFDNVLIVSLAERIFISEGAEERTVILLADGYRNSSQPFGDVRFTHSALLSEVPIAIKEWSNNKSAFDGFMAFGVGSFVDRSTTLDFISLSDELPCISLGEIASINIGIVTGDTKYFIRKQSEWESLGITDDFYTFVVPKIKDISGVNLTKKQTKELVRSGCRCLLLDTAQRKLSPEVILYLSGYPDSKKDIPTYQKRSVWHQPNDEKTPDGFFTFLTHNGPRIVLNSAGVNCTNSVHRVFFKKKFTLAQKKFIAISMLSTFSQLNAEIIGRPCGSGALKLEPRDALNLKIVFPKEIDAAEVNKAFLKIQNELLKSVPDEKLVRDTADKLLVRLLLIPESKLFDQFDRPLIRAREHRKGAVS